MKIKWLLRLRGFKYDYAKRMWYKSRSECHNATTHQISMLHGVPLEGSINQLGKKEKHDVTWQDICDECVEPCRLVWTFKHER